MIILNYILKTKFLCKKLVFRVQVYISRDTLRLEPKLDMELIEERIETNSDGTQRHVNGNFLY